ncbi:MAG: hypothetical protein IH945_01635 [Armatimonadetes bacterium]|nr:hypothetical protein [Armatimonadota bacterium]
MRNAAVTVLGLAIAGALAMAPAAVLAQTQDDKIIPSLDLDQADIRDALKIIFKNAGYSYSVDQNVQGTVTVHLTNIPFETALRNVLNQVVATYRIVAGIYNIVLRPTQGPGDGGVVPPVPEANEIIRKIYIRSADPALIFAILSGTADIGTMPESSTLSFGGGFGGQGGFGGGGRGGFGGGGQGGFGGGGFGGSGFGGSGFGGGGRGGGGAGIGR